jgi:hypothetical protein
MMDNYLEDTLNCLKETNSVVGVLAKNQRIIAKKTVDIVEKVERQEQELEKLKDVFFRLVICVGVLAICVLIYPFNIKLK